MSIKHLPVNYSWSSKNAFAISTRGKTLPSQVQHESCLFCQNAQLAAKKKPVRTPLLPIRNRKREGKNRMKMNVQWHWLSHTQTFSICDSLGSSDRSRGHKALVPRQLTRWLRSRISLRVSPKYRRVSTVWFMPGLQFVGLFCHSQGKKRNGWHEETFLLSRGNVERCCIFLFQCSFEVCDQEMCFS